MSLEDQLGAVDPQSVDINPPVQQAPTYAQNVEIDPQTFRNRHIRKGIVKDQPVDPADVADSTFRSGMPDLPPGRVNPGEVADRIFRDAQEQERRRAQKPAKQPAADLSQYGDPIVDLSQYGEAEAPEEKPEEKKKPDWGGYGSVIGKSAAQVPTDIAGGLLQGAGLIGTKALQGAAKFSQAQLDVMDRIDKGEKVRPVDDAIGYGDMTPEQRKEFRTQTQPRLEKDAKAKYLAEDNPVYQAGKSVKEFGEKQFPLTDTEKGSLTSKITKGTLLVAPLVAAGIVAPEAAIPIGGAMFGLTGAADTYEDARKKGASPEDAMTSAGLSGAVNAALGTVNLGFVLKPIQKFMPETESLAIKLLARAGQSGVTFTGIGEAQEFLGQQIGKIYNPQYVAKLKGEEEELKLKIADVESDPAKAAANGGWLKQAKAGVKSYEEAIDAASGYSLDAQRMIASFATGAILGTAHGLIDARTAKKPVTTPGEEGTNTGDERKTPPPPPPPVTPDETGNERITPPPPPQNPERAAREERAREHGRAREAAREQQRQEEARAANASPEAKAAARQAKYETSLREHFNLTDEDIAAIGPDGLEEALRVRNFLEDYGIPTKELRSKEQFDKALKEASDAGAEIPGKETPPRGSTKEDTVPQSSGKWEGLNYTLETDKNNVRTGVDPETSKPWQQKMGSPHGYWNVGMGADGGKLDVYVGPDRTEGPNQSVIVIDEKDKNTGAFRQHKTFIGFSGLDAIQKAIVAYKSTEGKSHGMIGGIRIFKADDFKKWVKEGDLKAPVSDAMKAAEKAPGNAAEAAQEVGPEAGHEHHAAVENVLRAAGVDPATVRPADVARASEIHAEEGAPPDEAFPVAVVRSLVEDGHISRETVEKELGHAEASQLLDAIARARGEPPIKTDGATARREATAVAGGEPARGAAPVKETATGGEKPSVGEATAAGRPEGGRGTVEPATSGERVAEAGTTEGKPARAGRTAAATAEQVAKPTKATVRPSEKQSLLEFIAARGGIDSSDPLVKDIQQSIGHTNKFIPGYGTLIRQGGKRLDSIREAAVEAGYLHDPAEQHGGVTESTIVHLLDAVDKELRGEKQYRAGYTPETKEPSVSQLKRDRDALHEAMAKEKIPLDSSTKEHEDLAVAIFHERGGDPLDALEAAAFELERNHEVLTAEAKQDAEITEDLIDDLDRYAAPKASEALPAEGGKTAEGPKGAEVLPAQERGVAPGASESAGVEVKPSAEVKGEQRPGEREPAKSTTERTSAGEQAVLPGAERISDREHAQRGADERLKPKAEQKAADEGLFGDESKQTDLLDAAKKPAAEHPGLVIKSLETGKETHVKVRTPQVEAMPGTAPLGAKAKSDWTEIGRNETGHTLYEDQRGVRSYIVAGVRRTEPVPIVPSRGGVTPYKPTTSERAKHGNEWLLTSEVKAEESPDYQRGWNNAKADGPESARRRGGSDQEKAGYDAYVDQAKTTKSGVAAEEPDIKLARALANRIKNGESITNKVLQDEGTAAFGGTLAEGKFDRKDAHDALELAVNMAVREDPKLRIPPYRTDNAPWKETVDRLIKILDKLPTQRVRSEEQQSFQQFSTPPHYSAAVVYAASLRKGDVVLEPSAGTGSLVAAASAPGVKIIANELAPRRAELLRALVGDDGRVFTENAEQLDNILPADVKPSVVVMNPPFSQTAGRMGDKRDITVGATHIKQALGRLEPGGRLVAIVGRGMSMEAPAFKPWWKLIEDEYAVRANIGVDGDVYGKYGTNFGTRLLVIDKVAPTSGEKPITAEAHTVDDLMRALEPIRDARPQAIGGKPEFQPAQPSGVEMAQGGEGRSPAAAPVRPEPSVLGAGERGGRGVATEGQAGVGGTGGATPGLEAGKRPGVAAVEPERAGTERAGAKLVEGTAKGEQPKGGGGVGPQPDLQQTAKPESGTATSSERIELEHAEPGTQTASEISESLYEEYQPQRVKVPGAKKHPGPLVQSAAMASVEPPLPKYKPALPREVIDKGLLSNAQLEPVIYAGEAHSAMLPAAENETPKRRGYFIGDGTGVGKGREVAGIILDNWQQGRTKAVWVSEKRKLLNDAKRDWSGLKQNPNVLFDIGKVKSGEPIGAERGIGFVTYDTLKGGMSDQASLARGGFVRKQPVSVNGQPGTVQKIEPGRRGQPPQVTVALDNKTTVTVPGNEVTVSEAMTVKSRVDQLADWLGKDFDGVIAFDEAHNMGNAITTKGERGTKDAAQKALAGLALQDRLPNARVVYVSATGATEVSNLSYADRLGLWGRGTPFASRDKFITEVEKGGIAAMELIARDMKQLGIYIARNLSYDGVEYNRLEHKLDPNQREIYDTVAEAWQIVLRNIHAALEETGGNKDARAKSAAMSAFWGGHQRFFNQIVTSLQMPSVIKAAEKDLKEGRQVVLQLTNTNEASQERAAAKAETAEDIEDLDITPRDQIIQLVEKSFPTQEYEQYRDENGNERSRPVADANGNAVQNKKAVAMKEALIDRLASVRVPQGPLDMILDHFGTDVVAEVTGRKRRFVMKEDEKTGQKKRMEESRPGSSNQSETDTFQAGKKQVLVFSEAGGTGASYHADNSSGSKDARRSHYLVQAGWRADKAVQGFGRTHRTNQASAPIFHLVTTDLDGQKRFISSIARRLGQLGALTKGERKAGDQGIFSARDNLESKEAHQAISQFYNDLLHDNIEGVRIDDFEAQTGLSLRIKDDEGRVTGAKQELPPITQFLNRLLSLKIDLQNKVFRAFSDRLDHVIEVRQQAGLLDVGLETVKADKIAKETEEVVHTAKESGAETKYVKLAVSDKFHPTPFKFVADNPNRKIVSWAKSPHGKVYGIAEAPDITQADTGRIIPQYRIISPVSPSRLIARDNVDRRDTEWKKIEKQDAKDLWQVETEKAPEFVTRDLHLITGAILPVWDRLKGSPRVVRLQTDKGERFLGRVIPESHISDTLQALGAETKAKVVEPTALLSQLMAGAQAKLANGWRFKRSLVAGEHRIELTGPTSFSEGQQVKADGVFTERINYTVRYFVPTDPEAGARVLARLIEHRPVIELGKAGGEEDDITAAMALPAKPKSEWYYSAVANAIDTAKHEKAAPNQWLGMLRNTPGVKPEEMKWLGLEEWLRDHKGPVSKQELSDYVRANQIELKEVEKGIKQDSPRLEELRENPRRTPTEEDEFSRLLAEADPEREIARIDAGIRVLSNWPDDPSTARNPVNQAELDILSARWEELQSSTVQARGPTKFGTYTLPGGENYRELLLTLPEKKNPARTAVEDINKKLIDKYGGLQDAFNRWTPEENAEFDRIHNDAYGIERDSNPPNYHSSHWDEPNVLAHVRFNDRVIDGKKTLFVEEVQSDWHQQGKRRGYGEQRPDTSKWVAERVTTSNERAIRQFADKNPPYWKVLDEDGKTLKYIFAADEAEAIKSVADQLTERGVPDAPFKTTWPELAMKRMIRYAVENGYDKIAWTPGDVQAERYDLSKQIDGVTYFTKTGNLYATKGIDTIFSKHGVKPEQLSDYIGKDAADKVLNQPDRKYQHSETEGPAHEISGASLKVGGEGMRGFYDQILPAAVNKLVKKYGGKVGQGQLPERGAWEVYASEGGPFLGNARTFGEMRDARREGKFIKENPDAEGRRVHSLDITPQLRDAALAQGFPVFQAKPAAVQRSQPSRGLTEAAETNRLKAAEQRRELQFTDFAKRAEVEKAVLAMLDHMTGGRFSRGQAHVLLPDTIPGSAESGYGNLNLAPNRGGTYSPVYEVIRVALSDPDYPNPFRGVAHEATHMILDHFATDQERALLQHQRPRMVERVAKDRNLTFDQANSLSQYEIEAHYGEAYIDDRAKGGNGAGVHIGLRRLFERIMDFFRRVRAWLNGHGFRTIDDIYSDIYEGKMGQRESRRDKGEESKLIKDIRAEQAAEKAKAERARPTASAEPPIEAAMARPSRRPAGAVSRYPVAETISDILEAKNWPKLAKISQSIRIGGLNPIELRVKVQDKFLRWKRIEEAVGRETGQPIPEDMQTYLRESLYYGRTGEQLERLDQNHIDPLIDDIKKRGLTLEKVDQFLMARHAEERNEKLRKINPSIADPSGMSDAEARRIMKEIYDSPKRSDYAAIGKRVRALTTQTLETLVKGGLISNETAARWAEAYKFYVPLRGWAEGPDDPNFGTGRGFDVRGEESKQALGRSSVADSPLSYVLLQAQNAIIRAEKNRVGQTALNFVRNHPDPGLWKVDKGNTSRKIDTQTGLVKDITEPMWHMQDNVFAVKEDGKVHYINFQGDYGEALARGLNNLGTANMGPIMRFVSTLTRTMARLSTSWNPDFMIPNFVRDAGEAFINLQAQDQKKFVKQFSKHLIPSIGGAFNALKGGTTGKYTEAFHEFDKAGGRIRFFGMENVEDIKTNIERKMKRLEGGVMNSAAVAGSKLMSAIEIANGGIENATRLAAFMAGRDVGLTKEKSASIARELTVNFNRKGEYGQILSGLYMFANASLQGSTRMAQALSSSPKARRMAYALAAAAAAMALYNLSWGGDDEDGVPFYLKIPPWERDTNLILMWPKGMGMDGKYVKLPLPYGYSFFATIGARSMTMLSGKEKASKAVPAMAKSVFDAFDPLGRDENSLAQFAPTIVKPAIHIYTNENWTGRPINPSQEPWNKHEPRSSRSFRSASEGSKTVAEGLNALTGGTKREPGWADISPGSLDYLFGTITGGLGRFVANTAGTVGRAYEGQEWKINKTPIVHRFFGEIDPAASRAIYFEEREKVNAASERLQGYRKDHDPQAVQRFRKENQAEISSHEIFKRTDEQRKKINEQVDRIKANKDLSAADRETQLKVQEKRELDLMMRARKQIETRRNAPTALP
jgi:hypothetical protein